MQIQGVKNVKSGGVAVSGDKTIYWAQLSRFHLNTETEASRRNVLF
jgi:hypothetical protein